MSSLFIIGNGFDRAHKLPTSYKDFRKFLFTDILQEPYTDMALELNGSVVLTFFFITFYNKSGVMGNFATEPDF